MRIYINGRFLSQRLTGVQRYAREVLEALDHLLAEEPPSGEHWEVLAPYDAKLPSLRAIKARLVGPFRGHAWEQLSLPLAARDGLLWSFGPTGPVLTRRQVVTFHDAAVYRVPEGFSRAFRGLYRLMMPALARQCRHIMTVSHFSRDELIRVLGIPLDRITISGEGHEHVFSISSDAGVIEKHKLSDKPFVLAVSSLAPYKNFSLVLRAVELLAADQFEVVVAGGSNSHIFSRGEKSEADRGTKFVGYVSDEELRALYERASLFIFPSRYEGFGLPPIEAMALGCPVLASAAGAIPEVCGDAARYFDPTSAEGLATAIRETMENPDVLSTLQQRGHVRAGRHRWRSAAKQHLDCARRIAATMAESSAKHAPMGSWA